MSLIWNCGNFFSSQPFVFVFLLVCAQEKLFFCLRAVCESFRRVMPRNFFLTRNNFATQTSSHFGNLNLSAKLINITACHITEAAALRLLASGGSNQYSCDWMPFPTENILSKLSPRHLPTTAAFAGKRIAELIPSKTIYQAVSSTRLLPIGRPDQVSRQFMERPFKNVCLSNTPRLLYLRFCCFSWANVALTVIFSNLLFQ